MKIYISGTISKGGTLSREEREENYARFYFHEGRLREEGHEPVNPLEVCSDDDGARTWEENMKKDISALLLCEAILMLPGWEESKGARLERFIAGVLGLEVLYV